MDELDWQRVEVEAQIARTGEDMREDRRWDMREDEAKSTAAVRTLPRPRVLEKDADLEQLVGDQLKEYSLHAQARRERVIRTLSDRPTMLYLSFASSLSLETLRIKLLRLLDPERSVEEHDDWEQMMACGLSPDRIPPHLLD